MNIGIDVHCKTAKDWAVELVKVAAHDYDTADYYRLYIGATHPVVLYLTEAQVKEIRDVCSDKIYGLEPDEDTGLCSCGLVSCPGPGAVHELEEDNGEWEADNCQCTRQGDIEDVRGCPVHDDREVPADV